MFGRQALGRSDEPDIRYANRGGRQYTSYYTLIAPYSPTTWLTGYFGAHPGDLDELDVIYRANNSIVYTSPKLYGVTVSGSYSLAGVPDSVYRGSTWSAAIQYQQGPIGWYCRVLAHQQLDRRRWRLRCGFDDQHGWPVGCVRRGNERLSGCAGAESFFAVGLGYVFKQRRGISRRRTLTFSTSRAWRRSSRTSRSSIPLAPCCTGKPATAWDFAAGYSYTWASKANGVDDAASYHQFPTCPSTTRCPSVQGSTHSKHSLSARSGLNARHARGRVGPTNSSIAATASIGDGFQSTPVIVAQHVRSRRGYRPPLLVQSFILLRLRPPALSMHIGSFHDLIFQLPS